MKESEAKTKWCPHARAVPYATGCPSGNVFEGVESNSPYDNKCKCIASDCMMWESWEDTERVSLPIGEIPEGEGWRESSKLSSQTNWVRFVPSGNGDCGLKTKDIECRGY